jgi:hypothetical protein
MAFFKKSEQKLKQTLTTILIGVLANTFSVRECKIKKNAFFGKKFDRKLT